MFLERMEMGGCGEGLLLVPNFTLQRNRLEPHPVRFDG